MRRAYRPTARVTEQETAPFVRIGHPQCALESAAPGELNLRPYYQDEGLLGAGQNTVIRQAVDLRLGRHVALKILRREPAQSADLRALFIREARLSASIDHPGIATVLSAGVLPKLHHLPYQALRIVRGRTLAEEFRFAFRPDQDEASIFRARTSIVLRVAKTIAHLHQHGVIHRDLHPANCMVSQFDEVVILDLGIVALSGVQPPSRGPNVITDPIDMFNEPPSPKLRFKAPEQLRGQQTGAFTDVYALGGLLFSAWAGLTDPTATPFDLAQITHAPAEIRSLITASLNPRWHTRPATVRAFIHHLQQWMDQSSQATPVEAQVIWSA